jgi:peptidoglycan-N-acetylglucosamine deacetylase
MLKCAISVDLDEIPNYCAIHGVHLTDLNAHAVYDVALERLRAWAAGHGLPLTLFAIAQDLSRAGNAAALGRMHAAGHEIANHSLNHYYDLTRRSQAQMSQQVWQASDAIGDAVGHAPQGFRAPGYVTTDELYAVLSERDLLYSSSVFPCPWYYGAKGAAIGGKALVGKRSASLVDDPRVLTAPIKPYRVGKPYWQRGHGLLELPIGVTAGLRLPFIGTSVMLAGPARAAWLTRQMVGQPLVNFELHGIDVLDRADGLEALVPLQPDVRIPLARKLQTLDRVVYTLKEAGYSFCTLAQAAGDYQGQS